MMLHYSRAQVALCQKDYAVHNHDRPIKLIKVQTTKFKLNYGPLIYIYEGYPVSHVRITF